MCGLPGSGKTTLARRLEHELEAFRFSPDDWLKEMKSEGRNEAEREHVERLQWDLAQRLLEFKFDVVLENGFWSRAERDRLRARAAELGAETKVHYLDVPLEELQRRLALRERTRDPRSFAVSATELEIWSRAFEPPDAEELGETPEAA
jgi:predicted kinase